MCLQRKKKGKSKDSSRGFCIFDSETEQRALQFLHIHCSEERSHSSAPESNKQLLQMSKRGKNVQLVFETPQQVMLFLTII